MIIGDNLQYTEEEGIGYLYLDSPHGNRMSKSVLDDLINVFDPGILQLNIRGLIILGKGRHFSSGADVEELIQSVADGVRMDGEKILTYPTWFSQLKTIFNAVAEMTIPVITGVSGFCIGSGLELALAGSLRLCAKGSVIGFPESTFGLLPGATGTYRSMELIGMSNSMELVLGGQFVDAENAVRLGLFHKICPKKEVEACCRKEMALILKEHER